MNGTVAHPATPPLIAIGPSTSLRAGPSTSLRAGAPAAPVEIARVEAPVRGWSLATRVAFRFGVSYFALYILTTQMVSALIVLPVGNVPQIGDVGPLRWTVEQTATRVFGITQPLVITGSGSGDKTFDWVQVFCFLVLATVATAVWSFAARRAESHVTLYKWFHLFLRCSLAATLVGYGSAKVIPLQMPYPPLTRLVEPFGHFSPMGVLWYSIGASRAYEIFTGCAEMAAGILLFIPQTATLGALVALACTIQIFALNMTYDVPVKLFSFQLLLMSLFLLAPEAKRLVNVLVLNRAADPSPIPPLALTRRRLRAVVIAQLVFAAYIVGMNLKGSVEAWTLYGGGAPKSPLYGVWNVTYLSIDGIERAALVSDYDRWRRLVFDVPARMWFQRMDDTFAGFNSKIDMTSKSIALSKSNDQKWAATLRFDRVGDDRMTLAGEMDGRKIQMRLELFPRERFLLVSRGFNWVQEYPFNR
jgi:hypothetical protein